MNNPGGELKTFGNIIKTIGIILSILEGILIMMALFSVNGLVAFLLGIVVIAFGIFLTWLGTIFVIAFGELTENSTMIRRYLETGAGRPSVQPVSATQPVSSPKTIQVRICPICSAENPGDAFTCQECGFGLSGEAVRSISGSAHKKRVAAPVSKTMRVCTKCGTDIPPGTKYCVSCGTAAKD